MKKDKLDYLFGAISLIIAYGSGAAVAWLLSLNWNNFGWFKYYNADIGCVFFVCLAFFTLIMGIGILFRTRKLL